MSRHGGSFRGDAEERPLIRQSSKRQQDSEPYQPGCGQRLTNFVFLTYFKILFKYRWIILLVWALSIPAAAYFTKQFMSNTKMDFQAPDTTEAFKARTALNANYPKLSTQGEAVILVQAPAGQILNESYCDYVKEFSAYLNSSLQASSIAFLIEGLLGPYYIPQDLLDLAAEIPNFPSPRLEFANGDQSAATLVIEYQMDGIHSISAVVRPLLASFKPSNCSEESAGQFSADITGYEAMMLDLNGSIEADTTMMDAIAVPMALLIFWFFLQNIKMLILPLTAMLTSILYSSALMYPVSMKMSVSSLAPTLMSSMCVAVSTDYTLFLLTRFNEERRTKGIDSSIANMLYFAGHVIITSGMTLAVTFAAMLFYPTVFLQGFGAAITVAILCSIASNLLITPTLLLCFPRFFTSGCCGCGQRIANYIKKHRSGDFMESPEDHEIQENVQLEEQKASKWYRWVKFWDSPSRSILLILLVLACTIPVIYFLKDFTTTTDSNEVFASNSRAVKVMDTLKEKFNPGLIAPYRILTVAKNKTAGIITQGYWDISADLKRTLNDSGLIGNSSIISITNVQGMTIDPENAKQLLDSSSAENPLAAPYQYLADQLLNEDRTAALTSYLADFDPMSRHAEGWIAHTRTILSNFSSTYTDYEFYLYGGSVEVVDLVNSVSAQFPLMVAATCTILFVIVGITFKSILIPIRGLFTIGLSVAWTFGLSVLVFEKAMNTPLYWFTPIFAFSIVVGLGLDYDIFLISRIHEYRNAGFNTQASIVKGTYLTGSIITGAGLIMIIAFLSLTVSHVQLMVQFAVVLASAVFLDTFVVRTALVPAIMRLFDWVNWWPSKYGSAESEAYTGMYGEDYFLDEDGEDCFPDATLKKNSKLVRPHDLGAYMYRKQGIEDIISNGSPGCCPCECRCRKEKAKFQSQTFE